MLEVLEAGNKFLSILLRECGLHVRTRCAVVFVRYM